VVRVEKTADGVALMRALEQHARPPLFEDPVAASLLSGWPAVVAAHRPLRWLFLRAMERAGPGFYGAVVGRTRAIDDECRRAASDGIAQVVIIGAGMDTRPYRLPELTRVWEFDLPQVQRAKRAMLTAPADHVTYVPVDLTSPGADAVLAAADTGTAPVLLLCEAVTMYLPADAVERILAYAGRLPPGSRLILTYLPREVAESHEHDRWSRRLGWRTSYHPHEIAARLTAHGLTPRTDIGHAEHRSRLLHPAGRTEAVFPGERIVVAERFI